ncbi:MAG: OmpA family protein [Myxococcota bacterium]
MSALSVSPASAQDEFGGDEFGGDEFGDEEFGSPPPPEEGKEGAAQEPATEEPAAEEPPPAEPGGEFGPAPDDAPEDADEGSSVAAEAEDEPASGEDEPAAGDDEPAATDDEEAVRARKLRRHNTIQGPVGGIHVLDAGSGPPGTFRVQLAGEFFVTEGYIRPGDDHDHVGGTLSLSWSVIDHLELFASVAAYANSNTEGDPQLLQVLGDTLFGVKAYHELTPWLTLGGDASLALLNTVGDIGLVFDSTSFGFRANATADLQGLAKALPLVFRLNLQYWLDNSRALVEDVEEQRRVRLPDARPSDDEFRHLVLPEERLGLQINRTDFFNIALGVEAPLEVADDFFINPILEWVWNVPVNRQGYSCLIPPPEEGVAGDPFGRDGCLDIEGASAFHQTLTLAVRVQPPVKGLAFFAGADIGLTGTGRNGPFVRELAPNAPYNILLAASYAYDTRPEVRTVVEEVEREVEVAEPEPAGGRIRGTAVDRETEEPVAGATVAFPGRALNAIVGGDEGTFRTYVFEPGEEVEMRVTHPDYEATTCSGTLPEEAEEESEVEVRCELAAAEKEGSVTGTVRSADGDAVSGAELQVRGPLQRDLKTDDDGRFALEDAPAGSYTALVQHEDYLVKLEQFEVEPREENRIEVTLVPRPQRSMVRVRKRQIVIRRQINFATNSADIVPASEPILHEVADVLLRNPHLKRIEIQGHTDNRGADDYNMELSQNRAASVRQWLVDHGVASERLEAKGYGETRPLVPNITAANRARNRRVQFMIEERGEPDEGQ